MAIVITDPSARDAIDRAEGGSPGSWKREDDCRSVASSYSFAHALSVFGQFATSGTTIATIYGCGGFSRYYVLADGEIVFSKYHASQQDVNRAKACGFRIWE